MSFGKLGALGRGFGHLGSLQGAQQPPSGFSFKTDANGNRIFDANNSPIYVVKAAA
jgi:hypothetical protein